MSAPATNWAGNITFAAARRHAPTSVDELRRIVAGSDRVRALGSGHSFNRIADTTGDLVSVAGLPPVIEIDPEGGSVTVAAGVRYGAVADALHTRGLALHNMGSLPHISVAGACATGTHGSGDSNPCLAAAVRAVEMVTASGDLVTLARETDPDRFPGAVVALGTLGIVTRLRMDVVPTFEVRQYVYDDLPLEQLSGNLHRVLAHAYSVSVFSTWRRPVLDQVWVKARVGDDVRGDLRPGAPTLLGAPLADGPRHPVPGMDPTHSTRQGGQPGPWHARLPHFRMEFTPSSGEELQSEYLVPGEHAEGALEAVAGLRETVAPLLQIAEIRSIAADDLWLSPASGRDSVGFHFTWLKEPDAVAPVVAALEEALAPFLARPHWGKVFSTAPQDVAGLYERMPDFQRLRREYDPEAVFGNELVDRYLGT